MKFILDIFVKEPKWELRVHRLGRRRLLPRCGTKECRQGEPRCMDLLCATNFRLASTLPRSSTLNPAIQQSTVIRCSGHSCSCSAARRLRAGISGFCRTDPAIKRTAEV